MEYKKHEFTVESCENHDCDFCKYNYTHLGEPCNSCGRGDGVCCFESKEADAE